MKSIHEGEKPKQVKTQALTLLRDGHPIAIFGCIWLGKTVLHLWSLLSEEVRKTPIEFFKTCRELMNWLAEKYQIRRFQMDVRTDFTEGSNFASALGFKCEGVMHKFHSDGSDCYLYGRTL